MKPAPTWPVVNSASPAAKGRHFSEPAHPLDLQRIEIGKHLIAPPLDDRLWGQSHDDPPA